jgi:hypothetical protein
MSDSDISLGAAGVVGVDVGEAVRGSKRRLFPQLARFLVEEKPLGLVLGLGVGEVGEGASPVVIAVG